VPKTHGILDLKKNYKASIVMNRVLVTGFEPFGGSDFNTSQDLLELLRSNNDQLETAVLPTTFLGATAKLFAICSPEHRLVICLGESQQADRLCLEKIAVNLKNCELKDNEGCSFQDQAISSDGPAAYFSQLPLSQLSFLLNDNSIPAKISLSAGTFVCNSIFYNLEHIIRRADRQVAFIHLPKTKDQKELELFARGIQLLVDAILRRHY